MLYNHIKTAIRQALKYKGYSAINLLGLIVGLISCIPILLWVNDEVSVDRFHEKSDRIYQAFRNMYQGSGDIQTTEGVPQPLEMVLKSEYPEVDKVAILSWEMEFLFRLENNASYERGRYASPEFFQVFSFPFLLGNQTTSLDDVHSVVISQRLAENYFGDQWKNKVLGQLIKIDEREEFAVTGVFKNPDRNSSFQFDWILPAKEYIQRNTWVEDWGNGGFRMFLTLKQVGDIDVVSKRIMNEVNSHTGNKGDERVILQLFADHYLYSRFENGIPIGGRIQYVRIQLVIGLFILVIACINFMNLATARSSIRAKEIGVRKVLGAQKSTLGQQFFVESFMHSILSVACALIVFKLATPYFNEAFDKSLLLDLTSLYTWIGIGSMILIIGILSGSYPALLLSSFKIITSLKGSARQGASGIYFRHGLATFQFAISILLITGTIVVSQQMDFILTKNLGLDKENVVMLNLEGELVKRNEVLKSDLQKIPEVKNITFTSGNPLSFGSSTGGATWEGKNPDNLVEINVLSVGGNFVDAMGIVLANGNAFSDNAVQDSARFMINEVLAGIMGFENPIGQRLSFWGVSGEIIGVVRNFHMDSMYEPIAPLIIRYAPDDTQVVFIRTQGNTQQALKGIERVAKNINPAYPFRYQFMDEEYSKTYRGETSLSALFNLFAIVAIFISCLGLLGLSSFSADRRSKEIGIRKVHGASVTHLMITLTRDYALLMLTALIIAVPVAYIYLRSWLDNFAFRTDLHFMVFVISGIVALAIGTLTVSLKSWQAASVNPVKSLRDE